MQKIQSIANEIDSKIEEAIQEGYGTIVHGDVKSENILFSKDLSTAALYDFQYVGAGLGVQDVVYLFVAAADDKSLQDGGDLHLLKSYHEMFIKKIEKRGLKRDDYPFEKLLEHYQLALLDFYRFLLGWGIWGNHHFLSIACSKLLINYK